MPSDEIKIGDDTISPGETKHIKLKVSETFLSTPIQIPISVIYGEAEGPRLFVCAASHGDEMNGVGIIRELIYDVDHSKLNGLLVCIPVLNIPGFTLRLRYLPDGRDLNRNFPGKPEGNYAQRIANAIFTEVLQQCDYGIDIHTAGVGRSNMMQTRADMLNKEVAKIAKAYGTEIILDDVGANGTLRRTATEAGIPTISVEAGEPYKFERKYVRAGLQGVMNVLYQLNMLDGKKLEAPFQVVVKKTEWVRADRGGIIEMKTKPRKLEYEGDELCTVTNPFGKEVDVVRAPFTGMVVGVTTLPLVAPGSPICHMVKLDDSLKLVESCLKKEG
ncbi:MAG: succinylglutamate desuccinylase/aspartoacylase family protein [Candidatus Thermoplasmatota archaeon]